MLLAYCYTFTAGLSWPLPYFVTSQGVVFCYLEPIGCTVQICHFHPWKALWGTQTYLELISTQWNEHAATRTAIALYICKSEEVYTVVARNAFPNQILKKKKHVWTTIQPYHGITVYNNSGRMGTNYTCNGTYKYACNYRYNYDYNSNCNNDKKNATTITLYTIHHNYTYRTATFETISAITATTKSLVHDKHN